MFTLLFCWGDRSIDAFLCLAKLPFQFSPGNQILAAYRLAVDDLLDGAGSLLVGIALWHKASFARQSGKIEGSDGNLRNVTRTPGSEIAADQP
jgi:hypothetical protein